MPVVRLPDGRLAQFPDDMPNEEIKAFIEFKFPEAGASAPVTADTLMAGIRTQMAKDAPPAPQVEGNQYASSLPGPLGQLQNSMSAQQSGMIEGLTGNLSNELTSGAMAPFDAAASAVQGNGFDIGRSFNNLYSQGQEQAAGQAALNPNLNNQGNLTGALVLGSRMPTLVGKASTPLGMGAAGALEGGIYGSIYGAGGAEGSARVGEGLKGGGEGALGGLVVGTGAGMFSQPVSKESRIIGQGLNLDNVPLSAVPGRMAQMGPEGTIADLGQNLQGQAAAISTLPGPGSNKIAAALQARRAGANDRIKSGVDAALGPAPRISQIEKDLDANRKAINTEYEPVFQAKALSDNPFMDASPIIDAIDAAVPNVVGKTRTSVERVKSMLIDPRTGKPTVDPQTIMAVRRELDGMVGAETNTTTAAVLGDLRKLIDQELGAAVPGLKKVDARFAENAKQGESLLRGGTILNDGKTALNPADLVEDMINMSSGQKARLTEGARAEINRVIGTAANDRVKLQGLVRGEGSWNADKLRTLFGDEKADQLLAIIDRERKFAELENLATSGSRTQVLAASQDAIKGKISDPGIIREALNFQYGNAAGKVADRILGGAISAQREKVINRVAEALMGNGLTPKMEIEINRLYNGMPAKDKQVVSALLAGQGAN